MTTAQDCIEKLRKSHADANNLEAENVTFREIIDELHNDLATTVLTRTDYQDVREALTKTMQENGINAKIVERTLGTKEFDSKYISVYMQRVGLGSSYYQKTAVTFWVRAARKKDSHKLVLFVMALILIRSLFSILRDFF